MCDPLYSLKIVQPSQTVNVLTHVKLSTVAERSTIIHFYLIWHAMRWEDFTSLYLGSSHSASQLWDPPRHFRSSGPYLGVVIISSPLEEPLIGTSCYATRQHIARCSISLIYDQWCRPLNDVVVIKIHLCHWESWLSSSWFPSLSRELTSVLLEEVKLVLAHLCHVAFLLPPFAWGNHPDALNG